MKLKKERSGGGNRSKQDLSEVNVVDLDDEDGNEANEIVVTR